MLFCDRYGPVRNLLFHLISTDSHCPGRNFATSSPGRFWKSAMGTRLAILQIISLWKNVGLWYGLYVKRSWCWLAVFFFYLLFWSGSPQNWSGYCIYYTTDFIQNSHPVKNDFLLKVKDYT